MSHRTNPTVNSPLRTLSGRRPEPEKYRAAREEMVEKQLRARHLTDERVLDVILSEHMPTVPDDRNHGTRRAA